MQPESQWRHGDSGNATTIGPLRDLVLELLEHLVGEIGAAVGFLRRDVLGFAEPRLAPDCSLARASQNVSI